MQNRSLFRHVCFTLGLSVLLLLCGITFVAYDHTLSKAKKFNTSQNTKQIFKKQQLAFLISELSLNEGFLNALEQNHSSRIRLNLQAHLTYGELENLYLYNSDCQLLSHASLKTTSPIPCIQTTAKNFQSQPGSIQLLYPFQASEKKYTLIGNHTFKPSAITPYGLMSIKVDQYFKTTDFLLMILLLVLCITIMISHVLYSLLQSKSIQKQLKNALDEQLLLIEKQPKKKNLSRLSAFIEQTHGLGVFYLPLKTLTALCKSLSVEVTLMKKTLGETHRKWTQAQTKLDAIYSQEQSLTVYDFLWNEVSRAMLQQERTLQHLFAITTQNKSTILPALNEPLTQLQQLITHWQTGIKAQNPTKFFRSLNETQGVQDPQSTLLIEQVRFFASKIEELTKYAYRWEQSISYQHSECSLLHTKQQFWNTQFQLPNNKSEMSLENFIHQLATLNDLNKQISFHWYPGKSSNYALAPNALPKLLFTFHQLAIALSKDLSQKSHLSVMIKPIENNQFYLVTQAENAEVQMDPQKFSEDLRMIQMRLKIQNVQIRKLSQPDQCFPISIKTNCSTIDLSSAHHFEKPKKPLKSTHP